MNQTDKIIGNIGAIRTLIETFPMGFFERNGKSYTSAFEFIVDVLRSCGISDQQIISQIIGKIYGFEGKEGFTINGLYDNIRKGKLDIEPNNFINGLENSIKTILMGLITSIYTCSALPVLPNKVFDYDSMVGLMDGNITAITVRNTTNDTRYKLKIPMSTIDMLGMLSISPVSNDGKLYYLVDGKDVYYHKELVSGTSGGTKTVHKGETYKAFGKKYKECYYIKFIYEESDLFGYLSYKLCDNEGNGVESPFDISITTTYLRGGSDTICVDTLTIHKGDTYTEDPKFLYVKASHADKGSSITNIIINGNAYGFEVGDTDGDKIWVYLNSEVNGITDWEDYGGIPIDRTIFGEDLSNEECEMDAIASADTEVECSVDFSYLAYKSMGVNDEKPAEAVRYTYVPDSSSVDEESPEYIICYEGPTPNLLYRTMDMNAFIWYCLNRGNVANQFEENHLMWDSRVSAAKNGVVRAASEDWNRWYGSKDEEGKEFEFNYDDNSELLYPIIQIEKRDSQTILVRIPSQRYFQPIKRNEMIDGTYDPSLNKHYFNASIYKFDWEYLKNIQILNPKLLLVRFIEHLLGFSVDAVSSVKMDITRKKIEKALSNAVKNIITANDMEVENCWKSFSNEDFDELLNELALSKYTSSEYNGEVVKSRYHDVNDYINRLNDINSSTKTEGTTTMITKLVNDIMIDNTNDPTPEGWNFNLNIDSNLLDRFLWAIVMPIVESIFTPQVMLLMMINFQLMGLVNTDEAIGGDFGKIMNLLINKTLGLTKSLVVYIKNEILKILYEMFKDTMIPILTIYTLRLFLEHLEDWMKILLDAVKCVEFMSGVFSSTPIGYIDDVDYADIVNVQNIPQSASEC